MNKLFLLMMCLALSSCVSVGEFTPERNAQYEMGKPDCNKTPEKCINGVPW